MKNPEQAPLLIPPLAAPSGALAQQRAHPTGTTIYEEGIAYDGMTFTTPSTSAPN